MEDSRSMHRKTSPPPGWAVLAFLSAGLGLLLWGLHFTNWSLRGTIPDLIFPCIVGILGFASLITTWRMPSRSMRYAVRILSLPAVVGATLYALFIFILFIPPFTLGGLFWISEIAGETQIQQVASPDGAWIAEVHFQAVGAYTRGNGHILITARPSWLPVLEQDIYYLSLSYANEDTTDYVTWVDDNTLYVSETDEEVPVGELRWGFP